MEDSNRTLITLISAVVNLQNFVIIVVYWRAIRHFKLFNGIVCIRYHHINWVSLSYSQVDVIVNSTSKDLILGQGEISKTILTVAGSNIQKECKTNFPKGLDQAGKVIKTKSHKLTSCNAVYHGAAVKWDGDPTGECIKVSAGTLQCIFKWFQNTSGRKKADI